MLRLISTKLSRLNSKASTFRSHGFCFSNFTLKPISEMPSATDPHSFTVSYLRNSCGLSQESANSASKKLCIENPEKADSFLRLLRAHGLSETHVKRIIEVRPSMLLADLEDKIRPNLELLESLGISGNSLGKILSKEPRVLWCKAHEFVEFFRANGFSDEQIKAMATKYPILFLYHASKNFKPKLDFLRSIGLTDEDVARILSLTPSALVRSLENHFIPSIQVLRQVLGSDTNVVKVIKVRPIIVDCNLEKVLKPNISMLKSYGVPEHLILSVLLTKPQMLLRRLDQRSEILDDAVKLGFDPNTLAFFRAVYAMVSITKARWEQNVEAYWSFGFSNDQIHSAFRTRPNFMVVSLKKLKSSMDFLINRLNMESSAICRWPTLVSLSLEKTVIPRCSVVRLLMSKGLIKQDSQFITYLKMSEKNFLDKIVNKYREVLPDIVKVYEGEIVFQGFPVMPLS